MSGYVRPPLAAHWHSIDTINSGLMAPQFSVTGIFTWPTADLAIYVPVIVRARVVVKKLWFANSSTATGNFDLGLYSATGTALLRLGSTAKTTTSHYVWDCNDTTIGPGIYYLALANSTNTDTFIGATQAAPLQAAWGFYTQASALPLPATATFAVAQTLGVIPVLGMYLDTRVS